MSAKIFRPWTSAEAESRMPEKIDAVGSDSCKSQLAVPKLDMKKRVRSTNESKISKPSIAVESNVIEPSKMFVSDRVPPSGYAPEFPAYDIWYGGYPGMDDYAIPVHGFEGFGNYVDANLATMYADFYANHKTSKLKARPKKFRCPHCKVSFSNNGQLKGHVRIHTGERPFKCDSEKCGKSFTRNEELTRHKRIHTGLRPYPCDHCGKRFGRKDHLKKHIRTHFPQPRFLEAQFVPLYPLLYSY